jgi:hypothetical protein
METVAEFQLLLPFAERTTGYLLLNYRVAKVALRSDSRQDQTAKMDGREAIEEAHHNHSSGKSNRRVISQAPSASAHISSN